MDVSEYIKKYIKLEERSDGTKWGLCPFHHETTPSFMIDDKAGSWMCLGCGKSGNLNSFLMEYLGITYNEADSMVNGKNKTDNVYLKQSQKILKAINSDALSFFKEALYKDTARTGINYAIKRKLSRDTVDKFSLGYSPSGDGLYKYLKSLGYADDELMESSLFVCKNDKVYPKFYNRFMFPIFDEEENVVGFGGRTFGDDKPKYLNSSETDVFTKRHHLYGLNRAKDSEYPYFIMCEGYMDVIAMHQAGFDCAVATLGTAVTPEHAKIIKGYTSNVLLCYDSDEAGINAAKKAFYILANEGIGCSVINNAPYKDPDEFIKALGRMEFKKRIDEAEDGLAFMLSHISNISVEKNTEDKDNILSFMTKYF